MSARNLVRGGVDIAIDTEPDLLARSVARLTAVPAGEVRLAHDCPRCGSTEHGRPRVVSPESELFVSLSRCTGLTAVAATDIGPVGVDLESIARIARHPVADALLHRAEVDAVARLTPAARDRRLAELWTAKEAILKATGRGLNVDPRLLELRGSADVIELVAWPAGVGIEAAPDIHSFSVDADIVGGVAVLRR